MRLLLGWRHAWPEWGADAACNRGQPRLERLQLDDGVKSVDDVRLHALGIGMEELVRQGLLLLNSIEKAWYRQVGQRSQLTASYLA